MLALQFGAGNIGRGFTGALLQESGYKLIFADVVDSLVDAIHNERKYTVHITDIESQDIKIDNVDAINSTSEEIYSLIAKADLITTAVGVGILPKIATTIAMGLAARRAAKNSAPLNIIACENAVLATDKLKEEVHLKLSDEDKAFAKEYVGFANCSVDRIVPPADSVSGLDVAVEKFYE